MKRLRFLVLIFAVGMARALAAEPTVLPAAHAHNDYEHTRPLFDALAAGFGSIEADIYLVDGALLVAHERKAVTPARTLAALYLEPLRERVRKNGGRVHRDGPTVTLLIDVKSEAGPTYAALHAVLKNYAEMLTVFRDGKILPGAITVMVSGARDRAAMSAQRERYAALDGRLVDLGGEPAPAALIPWVSESWDKAFGAKWVAGTLAPETAKKLRELVATAHAQGRRIRFWNTPDTREAWAELRAAGVDLINTDHLKELAEFLRAEQTVSAK